MRMMVLLQSIVIVLAFQPAFTNSQPGFAQEGRMTIDAALKIVEEFERMDLRICKTRPVLSYVKEVAKQKANLEISEDELKKIFDILLYPNIDRPFEDDLIYEMASQIMSGGTVHEVARNLKGGIIKKIIVDRNLTADDYFDVYCHLKNAAAIGSDILKFAQRTSFHMKPLIERLPFNSSEILKAKTIAYLAERKLSKSIKRSIASRKFCTKPTLDYLVPVVIDHEFVDGSALTIAIWDKITSVTDKIEKEKQSVHLHISYVISGTKDDHCFETLLEDEWEVLRHRMIDRMREFYYWTALKQFLIISIIIAIVSILNLQLRIMRARKATDDQKLTDNFQESEKLLER